MKQKHLKAKENLLFLQGSSIEALTLNCNFDFEH